MSTPLLTYPFGGGKKAHRLLLHVVGASFREGGWAKHIEGRRPETLYTGFNGDIQYVQQLPGAPMPGLVIPAGIYFLSWSRWISLCGADEAQLVARKEVFEKPKAGYRDYHGSSG